MLCCMVSEAARRLLAVMRGGRSSTSPLISIRRRPKSWRPMRVPKEGVIQLTRALGVEWATHGHSCHAIAPGWIVTVQYRDFLTISEGGRHPKTPSTLGGWRRGRSRCRSSSCLASAAGRFNGGDEPSWSMVDKRAIAGQLGAQRFRAPQFICCAEPLAIGLS